MKGLITFILIGSIALFIFSSCSSEKKLQRRVERHGIKESIGFVLNKYPEYFKSKDTTIIDTVIINDTIIIKADTVHAILSDSSNFLLLDNDSISLTIDKTTNRIKIVYKERIVPVTSIIYRKVPCPKIICPDCDNLQDNTNKPNSFKWWWVIVGGVILGAFYIWSNRNVKN
jgi:hypothetical protein